MRKSILLILTMLLSLFTTTEVSAEAYAVWCEGNSTMYFLATDANLVAGGTYQGNTITEVWKGTQVTNNSSNVWPMGRRTVVFDSSFRDVRPQSTEKWFSGCGGLTSIQGLQYLNTSLVSSMEAMFAGCESLESLDLSSFDTKNVKSFYYMFSGCTSLKSLKLNFDISSASSMANMFLQCKSLKTLDLSCFKSNSMLDLSGMFCMCENLTSVDLSNLETASVKNMGSMFTNCYNLQSLDLSSFDTGKVTNMHEMFAGGYRLSKIYISSKWSTQAVTDSQQMFAACESLPNYNYSEDDKTHAHGGSGGYMTYKPGMEPKGLQDGELFTAKTIEGVEMTFKVISVSENTCMVGGDDWKNMAVDKSTSGTVTIPDKVNDFTVTTIGISAFSNCDKLVKVIMPQSLTTIKSDAFLDCDKLETADIPASVTEIGYQAFVDCYSLKSITIPDGITHIDYNTFAGTAVSSITIPNSVVRLENGAFGCLRNLTSVEIPASVVEISNPFVGCNALTTISVESGNPVYHSDGNCIIETATNRLVVGCKSSVIPSYVTILGNLSFANYNFVEFVVPEGITKVESSAFNNCNVMNKLTLPSTLTALEDYAIYYCSSLTTIIANMKKPFPIGDLKQGNYNNNLLETLYVPAGCKDLYKSTAGWKEIPNIIEMGGAGQQDEFESMKKDLVTRGMAIEAKLADIKTTLEGLSGSGATDLAEKCEQIEVAYLYVLESIQKATTTDELKQCQDDMTAVEAAIAELMAAIDRYQPDVPAAGVSPTQLIVDLNGEDGVINVPGAKSISIDATLQNGVPVYESYVSVRIDGDKIYVHPVAKGNTGFRVYYNDDSGTNSEWVTVAVVDNLDDVFVAKTTEGVSVMYQILDVSRKTCMVGLGFPAIDVETKGTVTIPETVNGYTVTQIQNEAFEDCSGVTQFNLPSTIEYILFRAFSGCTGITSITLPEGLKDIGNNAFVGCTGLTSINIPKNVSSLQYYIFNNCPNITAYTVDKDNKWYYSPEGSNAIIETRDKALRYGGSTTVIPEEVESIGPRPFDGNNYNDVRLPKNVRALWWDAFLGNPVKTIIVDEANKYFDSRNNCNAIMETATDKLVMGCPNTVIPDDTKILGQNAFRGVLSTGFKSFELPEGLVTIEQQALAECPDLESLTLPSTLKQIGTNALLSNRKLMTITIHAAEPPVVGEYVFDRTDIITLYVPAGSKAKYQAADGWKDFTNIVEVNSGQTDFDKEKAHLKAELAKLMAMIEDLNKVLKQKDPDRESELWKGLEDGYMSTKLVADKISSVSTKEDVSVLEADIMKIRALIDYLAMEIDKYQPDTSSVFTAKTAEGIEMTFKVISEDEKTVQVGPTASNNWDAPVAIDKATTGHVTIPSEVKGYKVTTIGENAFYYCGGITSVSIPETVTVIDKYAFCGCKSLEQADIPDKVTTIGSCAFYGTALRSVYIPASVTDFSDVVYAECPNLEKIVVDPDNKYYDSRNGCNAVIHTSSSTLMAGCNNTVIPGDLKEIAWMAMKGCTGLKSLYIPMSLTKISYTAFQLCSGIEKIEVESGNTVYDSRFGCNAIIETATNTLFRGCNTTWIPNSVVTIGDDAFHGSDIETLEVPSSVTQINEHAFEYCRKMTSITLPEGLKEIPGDAFLGCSSLKNITIPESVTSIGFCTFYGCKSLETLVIPNHVEKLDDQAFYECSGLKTVTIGSSVTSIGSSAFSGCSSLTDVYTLIENPSAISEGAFEKSHYTSATLHVPAGCKAKYQAADGWKDFTNIVEVNSGQTDFDKEKAHLKTELAKLMAMIHELDKVLYQKDPDRESELWKELDYVAMNIKETDSKISSISSEADAKNLEDEIMKIRTLIDYLTMEIDKYQPVTSSVFTAKTAEGIEMTFKVISEDEKTVQVGKGANQETAIDEKVTGTVTIPSTVEGYKVVAIGKYAFYRLSKITEVVIPEGVVTIGDDAFDQCTGLKKINFPEGLTSIGESSFHTCSSLQSLVIPASLTSIGYVALAGWSALTSIKVAEGNPVFDSRNDCNAIVRTSTNELIRGCVNTVIPEGISNIGVCAFNGCPFTTITLPSTVKRIDGWAFSGCKNLSSVTIPDGVTYIGYMAFNGCKSLQSVNLPSSLTAIGSYAFTYCDALETIYSYITKPFVLSSESPFSNFETTKLYVPYGTKALYLATEGWNKFQIIVEAEPAKKQKVDFSDFTESTPLNGTVIDNVFYSIKKDNGGYDTSKKCVVVNSAMSDTEMEAIAGETLDNISNKYTGMVLQVPAGKGRLSVNAQATGGLVLKVKIGTNAPKAYSLKGKMKIRVEYDVQVPTYIYIYAGETPASARARRSGVEPSLMIYGISTGLVLGDANGDDSVDVSDVVSTVNKILAKPSNNFDEDAADVNGDGSIDVADVVATVNIILGRTNAAREKNDATGENDRLSLTDSGNNAFSLSLDNEGRYVAAQFEVRLSEGQTLESVLPSLSRLGDHQVAVAEVGSGRYRVVVYDLGLSAFSGHNGELLTLQLADANSGLTIDNITFVRGDQTVRHFAPLFAGPTAITSVVSPNAPADIYSIDGHLLRRQATSTEGLKRGLYIVNGRKMYLGTAAK